MKKIILFWIMLIWSSVMFAQNTVYSTASKVYSDYLRVKAEVGDPLAMNDLGSCLDRGAGIAQSHIEAFGWFKKAAEAGNLFAQFNLGLYYHDGIATEKDYAKALYWYEKAAKQNQKFSPVTLALGDMYYKGEGMPQKDYAKALYWYGKAADQNFSIAQWKLADMYYKGEGMPQKDYAKALYWYGKAANQNISIAQYALGNMYYKGEGMPQKDYAKALYWYEKAAQQNFNVAQYALGNMYLYGRGTDIDYNRAIFWHEQAANQDFLYSMDALANCYMRKKDYVHAAEWLQKAYDKGLLLVCHNLADMYYYGNGVEQSYEKAFAIFSRGKNNPFCMYRLSVMLRNGLGTKVDNAQANALLLEAANKGVAQAQYQLGIDCYTGEHHDRDYKMAVVNFEKAVTDQYLLSDVKADIYRKLSSCYRFGRGVKSDAAKADEYMKLAAELGDSDAEKVQEWLLFK